jgi:hypothetical protein
MFVKKSKVYEISGTRDEYSLTGYEEYSWVEIQRRFGESFYLRFVVR